MAELSQYLKGPERKYQDIVDLSFGEGGWDGCAFLYDEENRFAPAVDGFEDLVEPLDPFVDKQDLAVLAGARRGSYFEVGQALGGGFERGCPTGFTARILCQHRSDQVHLNVFA
jgi:hypothetical protein